MAHQLTHEVYEHAPQDLSQAELNVLAVIAYHSQVEHRRCWMTSEEMQRRSRLGETGVRQALQRLARRGLECRVPQGVGKDGRTVYAFRGRSTVFRLPAFTAPAGCGCAHRTGDPGKPATTREGDVERSPFRTEGDAVTPPLGGEGDTCEPERRYAGVAQYERTELQGGTTEVTTRPRAIPDLQPAPLPIASTAAAGPTAPPGSLCGRADCRDPRPCGACGRARAAQPTAQVPRDSGREHQRRLDAYRRAEEHVVAAATCPRRCVGGYLPGGWQCDHQLRRGPTPEWYAVRDQLPSPRGPLGRRSVHRGRHHAPEHVRAAS